jgi:hypothetical protein
MRSDLLAETVGWAATAVFVGSYFFDRAEVLVRVQIAGAVIWIAYGALTRSAPVIAANLLVVAAALWKARRERSPGGGGRRLARETSRLTEAGPPPAST